MTLKALYAYDKWCVLICSGFIFLAVVAFIIVSIRDVLIKRGVLSSDSKHISVITTFLAALAIVAAVSIALLGLRREANMYYKDMYNKALDLIENHQNWDARKIFEQIPYYSDSVEKARECSHVSARYFMNNNRYVEAMDQLRCYKDDDEGRSMYTEALQLLTEYNARNGYLDDVKELVGNWLEPDGEYYLNQMMNNDGSFHYESNIENVEDRNSWVFDGIWRSQEQTDGAEYYDVAAFQYADESHKKLLVYIFETEEMITLVRQES